VLRPLVQAIPPRPVDALPLVSGVTTGALEMIPRYPASSPPNGGSGNVGSSYRSNHGGNSSGGSGPPSSTPPGTPDNGGGGGGGGDGDDGGGGSNGGPNPPARPAVCRLRFEEITPDITQYLVPCPYCGLPAAGHDRLQVTHRVDDNRVDLKTLQQYPQFGPDDGHKRMRDAYRFMVRFDTLATAQNLSLDKRIRTLQLLFYNEADRRWFERTMETVRASTPNLTWDDVRKLFEEHFGLKGQRDLFRNLLLTPAAHQRDNEGITSYYDRFIELASRAGESVEADNGLIVNHFRRGLTPFLRESLERMEATADYIANTVVWCARRCTTWWAGTPR